MSQPLIIDGVELTPVAGHPHTYRYTPLAATVARDHAGRAQISLIKAGTFAMLNCTTMWGVTGAALEVARAKIAAQLRLAEPSQVTLTPAPVEVGPVELLLGDGSGAFDTLLTAQSSGMPPYSAAFSATLTEAQRTSVEKALGGGRGFLAVRYSVRESTAAAHTTQTSTQSTSFSSITVTRTTDSGTSTSQGTSTAVDDARFDESPQAPESSAKFYLADAADWAIGG